MSIQTHTPSEQAFETELINYITTGTLTTPEQLDAINSNGVIKTRLWQYAEHIKTTEDLWANFKAILEKLNQNTLNHPLSVNEFAQVKKIISDLATPFAAGQFLYGVNGVSQIEIDLDDGRHVFLTVFDQNQIGAGDTVYQVVNQIQRPAKIPGKQSRIFDTTLLINGLPIIQIEEKKNLRDVNEALNQMHQYIAEHQYRDIFSTLQILVAITPNNVKYMANTTADRFNKDFAFNWQRKGDNSAVRDWREFADSMLSIPMAHQMATNFMILDGTKNKQMLKVMRPYQVYATQKVIQALKRADFNFGLNKLGYVWHTTGSGKTITSFKTAWLASRHPKVDKVVFLVDRIALTNQTLEDYKAYNPDNTDGIGAIKSTDNTTDLQRKLKEKGGGIIVTSVQKLQTLIKRRSFTPPEKNIVFIVDEAHRSTGGEGFEEIQKAFKHSAWVGYTGTPMFDETTNGKRTGDIFGELLHAYTIRNAIADKNVLGFKVDFATTINTDAMKNTYLPKFYREKYPDWSDEKISDKIANMTPEDMDDSISPSFYDNNPDHVKLVVQDIFEHWKNRSVWDSASQTARYNAILTTHVGGGKASGKMAMMYFNEFMRVNAKRREQGEFTLKVAVTYSLNTSNNNTMVESNQALHEAIKAYNAEFGTNFGLDDVAGYAEDVASRLNKSASDGKFLDIVIVIDQLLTGFNAPELNTLYVDRTLRSAGLIQAYSRTNRIANNSTKTWGRIVNYRWPTYNEKLMNEALAIYADESSANLSDDERKASNQKDGILAAEFSKIAEETREIVQNLREMTSDFNHLPPSEKDCEQMMNDLRRYNANIAKLKQYDAQKDDSGEDIGFDYDNPEALINHLGMTSDEEIALTITLTNELKLYFAERDNVPVWQIELAMIHIKDIKVDYDYLTMLVNQLLAQVEKGDSHGAAQTRNDLQKFADALEDRTLAEQITTAGELICQGGFNKNDISPDTATSTAGFDGLAIIAQVNTKAKHNQFLAFRLKWGLTDVITNDGLSALFARHQYGKEDLNDLGQIDKLLTDAAALYSEFTQDDEIAQLSKIKYRKQLREALHKLADQVVGYSA
ncbi:type I restriction endonuclease subunit R, EcoR124 family [Neisseria yangbaofengii]|uniref:type I restriction endonuclease subunit R, EcoR124 family n=1 Tax=Neisseria yangbaofengii TaxID=2709396 RepID=UPI0013E9DD91|nr:HsdR family type I site-specific deoxyribonuclease [Neisseria yangbaofengii]